MALQDNIKPGHCCCCGVPNRRNLCKPCRERWSVGDKLPEWLRALHNELQRQDEARRRNLTRLNNYVAPPKKRGRGQPRKPGVVLVSYERAVEAGLIPE